MRGANSIIHHVIAERGQLTGTEHGCERNTATLGLSRSHRVVVTVCSSPHLLLGVPAQLEAQATEVRAALRRSEAHRDAERAAAEAAAAEAKAQAEVCRRLALQGQSLTTALCL